MEKIQFGEIETIVEEFKEKIRILEETFVNPELTPQEDEEPEEPTGQFIFSFDCSLLYF